MIRVQQKKTTSLIFINLIVFSVMKADNSKIIVKHIHDIRVKKVTFVIDTCCLYFILKNYTFQIINDVLPQQFN